MSTNLLTELLPHQKAVVEKIKKQQGLLLYHGMGSGKTLSSIAMADSLGLPVQVVLPAALIQNYKKELQKHLNDSSNFKITSLQAIARTPSKLPTGGVLVVDEAHKVRDPLSKAHQVLKSAPFDKKVLLTGTPIFNSPVDIRNLIGIVSGEDLNPSKSVLQKWVDYYQPKDRSDFPKRIDEKVEVPMNTTQRKIYQTFMDQARREVYNEVKDKLPEDKFIHNAFNTPSRQISNTPIDYTVGKRVRSPKINAMYEDIINRPGKTVTYSNFISSGLLPLAKKLESSGVNFKLFTGGETKEEKDKAINDFNNNQIDVLLLSSSGAEGLDLKGTRQIQIMEPHWNDEKIEQVIARGIRYKSHAHLPEKDRNVLVKRYYSVPSKKDPVGVDQILTNLSEMKKEQKENVLKKLSSHRPRVEVILFNAKREVLVGKTAKYTLPGGGIESGETYTEAARREVREETGKNITDIQLINSNPYITTTGAKDGYLGTSTLWVSARLAGGPGAYESMEDVRFIPIDILVNYFKNDTSEYADLNKMRGKMLETVTSPDFIPDDTWKDFTDFDFTKGDTPTIIIVPEYFDFDALDTFENESLRDNMEKFACEVPSSHIKKASIGKGKITSTVGQFLVNSELPPEMRDYNRTFDGTTLKNVMQNVADKYPEKYLDVSYNLKRLGDDEAVFSMPAMNFESFESPVDVKPYLAEAKNTYKDLLSKGKSENEALILAYSGVKAKLNKDVIQEGVKKGNALAMFVGTGARGKPAQVSDTIAAPLLVSDFKNRPIKIIIDKSYAEGLTPAQYFAASYGTRRGLISTKLATPLGGYLNKMLGWSLANTVITENDCGTQSGVPYPITDKDNVGRYIAKKIGKYERNTLIDSDVISDLMVQNIKTIVVRSPMTCEGKDGVCKYCMGKTESGRLPELGYNAGINSSAAISEPMTQSLLSEKHTGGAIKKTVGGYPLVKRLLEVPTTFPGGAALAQDHGKVSEINKLPWGGYSIKVNDNEHITTQDLPPTVKIGDTVEKGDPLSEGIINPAEYTSKKGIGEGRRLLAQSLRNAYEDMGVNLNRVHFEVAARSFANFGKVDGKENVGDYIPGDTAHFAALQKSVTFKDVKEVDLKQVVPFGLYLAKPALHYTMGTEVTPKVRETLLENNINKVFVTPEKPNIIPMMVRIQDTASMNPDWVFRLYSQGLKKSLLEGVQRGDSSDISNTNFVHPYIKGTQFGLNPDKSKY